MVPLTLSVGSTSELCSSEQIHWSNSGRGVHGQLFRYLPARIVWYPMSWSFCGSVGRFSGILLPSTPVCVSYRPVMISERDGQHSGETSYARLNRTPLSTRSAY